MADWEKVFQGRRVTRLKYQELGINNRIYPWIITQNAEGATVKLSNEQMKELIVAALDGMGYENFQW